MSRILSLSLLVTTLLAVAAVPGARAQNASLQAGQSANQSEPAQPQSKVADKPVAAPAKGTSSQTNGSPQASGPAPTAGGDNPPPAKPVCFALSGRCVEPSKAHKGDKKKSLDLAAPDVRSVVSADELKEPLPDTQEITEVQESQTVAVKGESPGPEVPGGFGAIWWALNHPANAWKIFLPAE